MRLARHQLTCFLSLVVAIAAISVAGAPPASAAAPGGQIAVTPVSGAQRQLTLADVAGRQDVHAARYTLRAADGSTRSVTVTGISLAALLRAAGVDPASFTYVAVARPGGTSVVLPHSVALGGGVDGPPVLYADGQGTHLLRPATGAQDTNADDLVTVPDGALTLELHTGEPFAVQLRASTLRARTGQRVSFTSVVTIGSAAGLTFSWYFADGTPFVTGTHVTHSFRKAGDYLVNVNVLHGPPATQDVSPTLTVHVGATRHAASHATGSVVSGGGTGTSGSGSGTAGLPLAPAHVTAPAVAAPRVTPPASTTPPATPAASSPTAPRTAPPPQGTLVSGTLLASADTLPVSAGVVARLHGAAASNGHLHVPVGVWAALGFVALLALGWVLEARHTLPFWQP